MNEDIPDWNIAPEGISDQDWRKIRAELEWQWLCKYRPGGCPSNQELSILLLRLEGSVLLDDPKAFDTMARAIRYRLRNGITVDALSGFTAFFNPFSGGWYAEDRNALITNPSTTYQDKMNEIYGIEGDYVRRDDGQPVIFWWREDEDQRDPEDYYHMTEVTVAYKGIERITKTMDFGTYSQCHQAGFPACP